MSQPITFRRVTREDFPLLQRWLSQPHVARWWNHEFSPEAIERDFGPAADGEEPAEDHLVLVDGEPIGLIQFAQFDDYPEYIEEMEPVMAMPPGAASIDYLIGEPHLAGRGLGTTMIRAFTESIWQRPEVTCVIVPVNSANTASWRALLAAGYRLVARGDLEPDNPVDPPQHEILRIDRPTEA